MSVRSMPRRLIAYQRVTFMLAFCSVVLALGSCQVETLPVIGDTPMVVTEAPTVGAEPLAYPPPPTPTPWSVADLPPLPTYAPPGPLSGMRVLYLGNEGYATVNVDGTGKILIPYTVSNAKASPSGEKLLYARWDNLLLSDDPQEKLSIWTIEPDGNNLQLLVNATQEWYPANPIWSPDGTQIAYIRGYLKEPYTEGLQIDHRELWVMNTSGNNHRMITSDPIFVLEEFFGRTLFLRWMSNGYIYFCNLHDQLIAINPENGDIYRLMDNVDARQIKHSLAPDGEHTTPFTDPTTIQQAGLTVVEFPGDFMLWSADSTRALFLNNDGLWMRNLISGDDSLLLPEVSHYSAQIHGFSPGNRYLAFQTDEGLFIIDLESPDKQPQLLVEDPLSDGGNRMLLFVTWLPIP